MFRVYHKGALQGTTLITNYSVGGLLPCQQYQAKVEALCGDSVLMSAKRVTAHTGNVETQIGTTRAAVNMQHFVICKEKAGQRKITKGTTLEGQM